MSVSGSPGFIFWGLLLAFGLIVAGYVVWMLGVEARERKRAGPLRSNAPRAGPARPARAPSETEP